MRAFLSGGGLDSAAFMTLYANKIDAIVVCDYGQTMFADELTATELLAYSVNLQGLVYTINCRHPNFTLANGNSLLLGVGDQPIVNARNLWMALNVLMANPEIDTLYFGLCREIMMFPDATKNGIGIINEACKLSFADRAISVTAPYIDMPKKEYISKAYSKNNKIFAYSFTCWTPVNGKECGSCAHCTKKATLKEEICEKPRH